MILFWGGGASPGERKWHSVSWNNFCNPKHCGGVGFRDIHKFNKAFMMQLGWNLISNPNALWVQVVKAKYNCGHDLVLVVRNI